MMIKALSDFHAEQGVEKIDLVEYKSHGNDVPVKDYLLRRAFGSWNRVLAQVTKRHPVPAPVVKEAPKKKVAPKKTVKKETKDVK